MKQDNGPSPASLEHADSAIGGLDTGLANHRRGIIPRGLAPSLAPNLAPSLAPNLAPGLVPNLAPGLAPNLAPGLAQNLTPTLTRDAAVASHPLLGGIRPRCC